jgi:peptide/nickel transport system substrate-binding protein
MKYRASLTGAVALGLAAMLVAPMGAGAATKKKATTKKKPAAAAPTTKAQAAPAASGGKIVFGLEAESSEGFLPPSSQWAVSGHQVSFAVIERLMGANSKGQIVPWLAESMTPSSDFKSWTIKVRPGVKFHNGEELDAEAVVLNLKELACGSVTATALLLVNAGTLACAGRAPLNIAASGPMTVTVGLYGPWVSFPAYMAGQSGAIVAPAQLKAKDRNKPIGSGPFVFKEWQVGVKFIATKNPSYWRPGLPKLDEIEFRPITDENARVAQIQSGQIDITHTANFLTLRELGDLQKSNKINLYTSEDFGEVSYNMLNVATPPFNNRDCRLAAAHAFDTATTIKLRAPGATPADGPFPKGALGHLPDSGYPKFDLEKAKSFYEKCKQANGGKDVEFTLGTTNVPDNIETVGLEKQMFEKAGFTVKTTFIEQQRYIGVALVGAFQMFTWRNHGGVTPDQQRIWWHTETSAPNPTTGKPTIDGRTIALNFGRIQDSVIDEALNQIRTSSDPAVQKKAAESINRQFAEEAYNLWGWRTRWGLATGTKVGGVNDGKTVGGEGVPNLPSGQFSSVAFLTKG